MASQFQLIEGEKRSAVLSVCKLYRYELRRVWATNEANTKLVVFIGLNPSTADAFQDDQTIRRCRNFAKSWSFDGMIMINLFAYRATSPKVMKAQSDPFGPENDYYFKKALKESALVVGAWGEHGILKNRGPMVAVTIPQMMCLGITMNGQPRHPSRLPNSAQKFRFSDRTNK
ncbi:MAG TPA: DUF1643 domain-containing protein [Verrucomicrobiae bacterium]